MRIDILIAVICIAALIGLFIIGMRKTRYLNPALIITYIIFVAVFSFGIYLVVNNYDFHDIDDQAEIMPMP